MVVHFFFQWAKCINLLSTYYYIVDVLVDTEDTDMNQKITVGENRRKQDTECGRWHLWESSTECDMEKALEHDQLSSCSLLCSRCQNTCASKSILKIEEIYFTFEQVNE